MKIYIVLTFIIGIYFGTELNSANNQSTSINGTYICSSNCWMYDSLRFVSSDKVSVYGFDMEFPWKYTIKDSIIYIKTDKSDLILNIEDDSTLIGKGFAKGKYIKIKN